MTLNLTRVKRHPKSFSLATSDGKTLSTDDFRGKWLYLLFHRHLS